MDAPRTLTRYTVAGPDGRALPPSVVGLHEAYFGLDGYRVGRPEPHPGARRLPATYALSGRVPDAASLAAWVGPRCAERGLPFVDVSWTTWGADGGRWRAVGQGRLRVPAARP